MSEIAGVKIKNSFCFYRAVGIGTVGHLCMELLLESTDPGWAQPLESTDGSRYAGKKGFFHSNLDTDPPQRGFSFGSVRPQLAAG